VPTSATVEEIIMRGWAGVHLEIFLKMPSLLRCVDLLGRTFSAPDRDKVWFVDGSSFSAPDHDTVWPFGQCTADGVCVRSLDIKMTLDLQRQRAAFECALQVLPECVVRDIDDEPAARGWGPVLV